MRLPLGSLSQTFRLLPLPPLLPLPRKLLKSLPPPRPSLSSRRLHPPQLPSMPALLTTDWSRLPVTIPPP